MNFIYIEYNIFHQRFCHREKNALNAILLQYRENILKVVNIAIVKSKKGTIRRYRYV